MTPPEATHGPALKNMSAELHVSGRALFTDDLPEIEGTLFAAIGTSPIAHARLTGLDLDSVRAASGVVAVLTSDDLPGPNSFAQDALDDPIFAAGEVLYAGQSVFLVVARSVGEARRAARLARFEFEPRPAVIDLNDAVLKGTYLDEPSVLERGDFDKALREAPHSLRGQIRSGGQEHFYLEGQVALAVPEEDGLMRVVCSSQNPSEVQRMVARTLEVDESQVLVRCGRLGGGFGGKETQPALFACMAALAARTTGRPVKLRMRRDQDMAVTGKRHDFIVDYRVAFDDDGRIEGLALDLAVRCGSSRDLSFPVTIRSLLHCDNCYFLENVRLRARRFMTHTASNTAFRGFGAPQAVLAIESVIDEVARNLGLDPALVRRRNFYAGPGRDSTHYGMQVEDNILPRLVDELESSAGYQARVTQVEAFNRRGGVLRRGIALVPVKFGVSFTQTSLNYASALVQVYTDGSVLVHHGGVEMGQGLHTKMCQVAAREFGIDIARVRCAGTDTAIVPNSSPTAASASSDLNGKAVQSAVRDIKRRLTEHLADAFGALPDAVEFADGHAWFGNQAIAFKELVRLAHDARIALSATGHYSTPKIHFDPVSLTGRPFFYFVYGAAVSEVVIDTLTGEHRVERVDILQDAGRSLNPAVDVGQIEGAFLQGVGWLTSEELVWSKEGVLQTDGPATYKIPTSYDWPRVFNVDLVSWSANRENTIYHSKGIGEPPLLLATSVFLAIKDAIARASPAESRIMLDAPATPERVLMALNAGTSGGREAMKELDGFSRRMQ